MTKAGRIRNFIIGFLTVCMGVLIAISLDSAYRFAVFTLSLSLFIYSLRQFVYYAKMARHMVDGRIVLYRAIITFDLGIFTMSLSDVPAIYIMMYLIIIHLITGGIGIMRAMETRRGGGHWKLNFARSLIDVLIAVICIIFIRSITFATFIYGIGLINSGVIRIISSVRRNAIVFIQ